MSSRFFHFFKILIFRIVSGVKGQEMAQNKKFCLLSFISQEPYIIWLLFMVHLCKMIFPCVFSFLKILIFWVAIVVKGQKNGSKWKLCLLRSISQEPCIIWFSFMLHMCRMIISPDLFSFFQNVDFPGC